MPKTPYPGFAPSYRTVDKIGGYTRNCLVVEVLSIEALNSTQLAYISEQLEFTINKLIPEMATMENIKVVTQDRFDPILKSGLRLS